MNILVTGGAGFIGSHTVDALLEKGHDVTILDNLQKPVHLKGKPAWIPKEARFILGDVRNRADWEKALEGVEAVYHLAAYQDYLPDFSTFFHVNVVSTALLYEIAVEKKLDLARVVVASSQFVQGEGLYRCKNKACGGLETEVGDEKKKIRGEEGEKVREDRGQRTEDKNTGILGYWNAGIKNTEVGGQGGIFRGEIRPEEQLKRGQWETLCPVCGKPAQWQWTPETHAAPPNAYAMAKYSQEMQALTFGRRYRIPSVALRYSIVQGPRQSFYNTYSGACRIFSLNYYFGKAPTIYEDGLQCRDFVNIHDVIRANIMALEDDRMNYGVFNIGGGHSYNLIEFVEIVRQEVQKRRRSEDEKVRREEDKKDGWTDGRMDELPEAKVPGLYRFGDTRNACSDISRIRALGWEPQYSPAESVREYVDWLYAQDNLEDILAYAEKTMKNMNVVRSVSG
jgi:dTDP-L-rhamnose 4-epimerase